MTINGYQRLAMRTCGIPHEQKKDMLRHAVFGHTIDKDHIMKELGDCTWMIAEACQALDIKLEDVMKLNIEKLKTRYPSGFDPEKSIHRAEGDI